MMHTDNFPVRKLSERGTSLVVQWLRLYASTAGGTGSIPCQGTKILHVACQGQKKKKDGDIKVHIKHMLLGRRLMMAIIYS